MLESNNNRRLPVQTQTWARDSHGLFDYESQHTVSQTFNCMKSGAFRRSGDELVFADSDSALETDLAEVSVKPGRLYSDGFVLKRRSEGSDEDLWLVVRYLEPPEAGLLLELGQVVKLGRVKYRVKAVQPDSSKPVEPSCSDTDTSDEEQAEETGDDAKEASCRICWEKETEATNPLISQCHCIGSVKYVHLNCMKRWLLSKMAVRGNECSVSYLWKSLECDVCKMDLPLTIKHKGKSLNLFDIAKPNCPHIILEAVVAEKPTVKAVHVVMFDNGRDLARLGRGHDSDVRINDISVSRCHAFIRFSDSKFLLEDNKSKFGTLLRVNEDLSLGGKKVTVQMGRSLVTFGVEETGCN